MNEPDNTMTTGAKPAAPTQRQCASAPPEAAPPSKRAATKLQPTQTQAAQRKVRFELNVPKARSVSAVGTFNNWTPGATRLVFVGGTKWLRELFLAPGRYEYRFVVDGKWIDPPQAKAYVPNPQGGRSGVVEF